VEQIMVRQRDERPEAPRARKIPERLACHGHVRVDDYHWLNRRDDPEVIRYLEQENAYTDAVTAPLEPLVAQLFDEFRGRIKQTDATAPYRRDGFWYYDRVEDGREYRIVCRKAGSLAAPEQVLLDVNRLAAGRSFFSLGNWEVSPGGERLAWAEDTMGRGLYTLRFRDLALGRDLPDVIEGATAWLAWALDDRTLFYTRRDPVTLRSCEVWRHELGRPVASDELVWREDDERFRVLVWATKSKRYIMVGSFQTTSTEHRFLDAADPRGELRLLQPRERDHEYYVDHFGEHFLVRTNDRASNFRLVRAPVACPGKEQWEELEAHRPDVLLEEAEAFHDFLVLAERREGLPKLRIRSWSGDDEHELEFDDPAYRAWIDHNYEPASSVLRYGYESLGTPRTIYEYDMHRRERRLVKRDEVLGGFEVASYRTERSWATAADGTRVPISLVHRADTSRRDGTSPLVLYGYGAYGQTQEARFSAERLSLLDRGFTWAVAHVRGGEELGRDWYEGGKLLNKKNTFDDFIACAEHLVRQGYTRPDRMFAVGQSAGGLLMGVVLNRRPDLFRGVVAGVPFVDVVTTMLDESIPLTTFEYEEWGDPRQREAYDCMLSYSPYDNVAAQDYPALLVTSGLHDAQVQYWEPAKWVAKLRALRTNDEPLLLRTNMEAGHGGASGRYRRWRETAFDYAFVLQLAPARETP
jgi:oligopeptidase B